MLPISPQDALANLKKLADQALLNAADRRIADSSVNTLEGYIATTQPPTPPATPTTAPPLPKAPAANDGKGSANGAKQAAGELAPPTP